MEEAITVDGRQSGRGARPHRAAAIAAGRAADAVTLVAVSKTQPAAAVRAALAAGQRVFGENRVQEALAKFPRLRDEFPDSKLHLIGPLQTNKVKDAVAHCDVIETRRPAAPRRGAGARDGADRPPRCPATSRSIPARSRRRRVSCRARPTPSSPIAATGWVCRSRG